MRGTLFHLRPFVGSGRDPHDDSSARSRFSIFCSWALGTLRSDIWNPVSSPIGSIAPLISDLPRQTFRKTREKKKEGNKETSLLTHIGSL